MTRFQNGGGEEEELNLITPNLDQIKNATALKGKAGGCGCVYGVQGPFLLSDAGTLTSS